MSTVPQIVITKQDQDRLLRLIEQSDSEALARLEEEIERAEVVSPHAIPADVVTMNSDVVYEDLSSGKRRTVRLVYPKDADAALGRVSIFAPVGMALIGLRVGQEIEWPTPGGSRSVRVVEITYQPEAQGDFDL